jgi:putative DNA-invertase from lambdoid prophage Rac
VTALCAQLSEVHRSNGAASGVEPHVCPRHITVDMCRGTYQLHILSAISQFERERIRERVLAGLQRARTQGKRLGRPHAVIPVEGLRRVKGLSIDIAAARLGVSASTVKRWRRRVG